MSDNSNKDVTQVYVIKYTQTGISANRIYVLTFIAWTRNTAVTQKRVRSNSLNIQLSKKWSVEEKIIISLREHQLCYLFSFPKKPLRSNKHIKEICGLRKSWVLAASSSRIAEMITAKGGVDSVSVEATAPPLWLCGYQQHNHSQPKRCVKVCLSICSFRQILPC